MREVSAEMECEIARDRNRLAGAGHVLEQHMPTGEHPDQAQADGVLLALDDGADVVDEHTEPGDRTARR